MGKTISLINSNVSIGREAPEPQGVTVEIVNGVLPPFQNYFGVIYDEMNYFYTGATFEVNYGDELTFKGSSGVYINGTKVASQVYLYTVPSGISKIECKAIQTAAAFYQKNVVTIT